MSVAIHDMNGDGSPDLAVASYDGRSASVLLGTGDGTFRPRSDYPIEARPKAVAVGDLNRDGMPDLVLASVEQKVTVLLAVCLDRARVVSSVDELRSR